MLGATRADDPRSTDVTFSIVAHDPTTGQVGLAVQSKAFGVGRIIHHVHPGVGAVATQASVLPAHGTRTLQAMVDGASPEDALEASLALDEGRERRQVIALDVHGRTAGHTGSQCIPAASHHLDDDVAVAGNILADDTVVPAMVTAARDPSHRSLARRLLAVLVAAQAAGGDLRGRQSASMLVVGPDHTGDPLVDRLVDVRVDDHDDPIPELARLLGIAEAHHDLERAEHLVLDGDDADVEAAVDLHLSTLPRLGDDPEFHVWAALSLVAAGRHGEAAGLVAALHDRPDATRWQTFTARLVEADMLDPDVDATWW